MHISDSNSLARSFDFPREAVFTTSRGSSFLAFGVGGGVNVAIVYLCILQQNIMGIHATAFISFQFLSKIHAHIPYP